MVLTWGKVSDEGGSTDTKGGPWEDSDSDESRLLQGEV